MGLTHIVLGINGEQWATQQGNEVILNGREIAFHALPSICEDFNDLHLAKDTHFQLEIEV